MLARALILAVVVFTGVGAVLGQAPATVSKRAPSSAQQSTGGNTNGPEAPGQTGAVKWSTPKARAGGGQQAGPAAANSEPRPPITRVTTGNGQLPHDAGQLWREYDISPYTLRVEATARPEQAIVDWILRETGYEVWHAEPLSILSASERVLRVYHTAEMHKVVAGIVDRFVSTEAQTQAFGVRVITLSHPNWRARAQQLMQPVSVQTPGVQAWLLEKEGAAMLLAELRRRSDYREHSSPHLLVSNGQSSVVSATRGRNYVRSFAVQPAAWSGLAPETGLIDEGFSLEFSPLLSVDGQIIDATIKCEIDQVEKLIPVSLDVPGAAAARQRTKIEVPQMSHFRFHERFRWPSEQVLLIGMGMVALPVPSDAKPLIPGFPLSLPSSPPRADMLVFVQSKGQGGQASRAVQAGRPEATTYRGRY
jgi:hypothetical protein